mgnify:CR=1 FL=1
MINHKEKAEETWRDLNKRKNDLFFKNTKSVIYEQTKDFTRFIKKNLADEHLTVLDCACGNGVQANYLNENLSTGKFFAYDINKYLINEAKQAFPTISWFVHDCYEAIKLSEPIDLVYSLQTLSVLPQGYKKHFNTIEKLGPKNFSGSILLWGGDGDYSLNINNNRGAFVYNLYNMGDFKNSLKNYGGARLPFS